MQKQFIKNRNGHRISVVVEGEEKHGSLAFVMHGLGGWKDQPHIKAFAEAFLENGFTVVRFDTTNTYGESDGTYEDATVTNYYEDLEDIISWAEKESWYREPFWLAGHSLGGICITLYAEKYPGKVAGLAPISTVVSGTMSAEAGKHAEKMEEWKRTGWRVYESETVPGRIKRLPWSHMEDRFKYDALPYAKKLSMPVLLMAGEFDKNTPAEHQRIFYDALPGPKELHIIKGAPHTFIKEGHIGEIKRILSAFIAKHGRR